MEKRAADVEEFEEIPFHAAVMTFVGYAILTLIGHIRNFLRKHNFETSYIKKENVKNKVR
jgi:hypothetical protein